MISAKKVVAVYGEILIYWTILLFALYIFCLMVI
jgi:hypothetical protein